MAGAFLIILAILSGMGSISLGSYQVQIQGGEASGAYLVTNYLFVLIALGFGALGAFFVYRAGQASVRPGNAKNNLQEKKDLVASK